MILKKNLQATKHMKSFPACMCVGSEQHVHVTVGFGYFVSESVTGLAADPCLTADPGVASSTLA